MDRKKAVSYALFSKEETEEIGPFKRGHGLIIDADTGPDARAAAIIKKTVGCSFLVHSKQVHGKEVALIEEKRDTRLTGYDALMTNEPGIGLLISHADCQAALFYDPKQLAIAAVHAGWRGSCLNIYAATIEAMQQHFGSRPADLHVLIAPSLGPCHAEFVNYKDELPEAFWAFKDCKNCFDFWKISEMQLRQKGVHQITNSSICTFCSPKFYSYRRAPSLALRNASVIALKCR